MVRQRQPRERDEAYLAYLRTLPCEICGGLGCDPAHIRSPSLVHGKDQTGAGRKPSDKWALPLCRPHHDEQHRTNELDWWAGYGINPFDRAQQLYASRPGADKPKHERPRIRKARPRKSPEQRRAIPAGRKLESRSTFPPKGIRKLQSRQKVSRHEGVTSDRG